MRDLQNAPQWRRRRQPWRVCSWQLPAEGGVDRMHPYGWQQAHPQVAVDRAVPAPAVQVLWPPHLSLVTAWRCWDGRWQVGEKTAQWMQAFSRTNSPMNASFQQNKQPNECKLSVEQTAQWMQAFSRTNSPMNASFQQNSLMNASFQQNSPMNASF